MSHTLTTFVALEVAWLFYQDLIQAYGDPKKTEGKKLMNQVFNTLRKGLPQGLEEFAQLGQAPWRRCEEVFAYFHVGAFHWPVEAINGRLEHLRGIALAFRNLNPAYCGL